MLITDVDETEKKRKGKKKGERGEKCGSPIIKFFSYLNNIKFNHSLKQTEAQTDTLICSKAFSLSFDPNLMLLKEVGEVFLKK